MLLKRLTLLAALVLLAACQAKKDDPASAPVDLALDEKGQCSLLTLATQEELNDNMVIAKASLEENARGMMNSATRGIEKTHQACVQLKQLLGDRACTAINPYTYKKHKAQYSTVKENCELVEKARNELAGREAISDQTSITILDAEKFAEAIYQRKTLKSSANYYSHSCSIRLFYLDGSEGKMGSLASIKNGQKFSFKSATREAGLFIYEFTTLELRLSMQCSKPEDWEDFKVSIFRAILKDLAEVESSIRD